MSFFGAMSETAQTCPYKHDSSHQLPEFAASDYAPYEAPVVDKHGRFHNPPHDRYGGVKFSGRVVQGGKAVQGTFAFTDCQRKLTFQFKASRVTRRRVSDGNYAGTSDGAYRGTGYLEFEVADGGRVFRLIQANFHCGYPGNPNDNPNSVNELYPGGSDLLVFPNRYVLQDESSKEGWAGSLIGQFSSSRVGWLQASIGPTNPSGPACRGAGKWRFARTGPA